MLSLAQTLDLMDSVMTPAEREEVERKLDEGSGFRIVIHLLKMACKCSWRIRNRSRRIRKSLGRQKPTLTDEGGCALPDMTAPPLPVSYDPADMDPTVGLADKEYGIPLCPRCKQWAYDYMEHCPFCGQRYLKEETE